MSRPMTIYLFSSGSTSIIMIDIGLVVGRINDRLLKDLKTLLCC